jgi:hypothetical protein
MDKLWNVIFQLKDEKVLNKPIKEQTEKILNKY